MDNQNKGMTVEQAMAFAQSPDGQELIRLLRQVAPQSLENAQKLSDRGKNQEACRALSGAMEHPAVRQALRKLKL